jgi:hypothetical protein
MITVTWNPLGFHVVDKLPTGAKMNSDYFVPNILEPLEQRIFPNGRKLHAKRLTVHLENCSIYTSGASEVFMAEYNMIRLKHPPYSRDLAPSDFCLLPTIKERLTDIQIVDEEDFFYRLRELLNEMPVRELRKVFDTWIERLTAVTRGMEATCLEEQNLFRDLQLLTLRVSWRKDLSTRRPFCHCL